ncbi:class I SAM-dependent methyltransferase [Candidatus Saccharibacteria bacterium]|nr:class I SAM-dependent methyltransferase [Candidatus Saccharibacteria bacterium]
MAYAFVLPFGAPYLPTMKSQKENALDLLGLKPGQTLVDLGSGDGGILVLAAERGLKAVGYEINPFLWLISRLRTLRYGRRVKIKLRSFWGADLSQADGVFVFLITHKMEQLDRLLSVRKSKKSLPVVSYAFKIPGKKHLKKSGALFLYQY